MKIKRALILPDTHRPFHDRKAYSIMLEAASFLGMDEIVLLGDYCDFYSVSRHQKHPKVDVLLKAEVESVNQGLDELDHLFPSAKKIYLLGNHEARLESYLVDQAPALFGVTEVQTLFRLNQRPLWTSQEFGRNQAYAVLGSSLLAFHRPRASAPRLHVQKTSVSSVYGDVHKIEQAHAVGLDGKHYSCYCPGWLGDVSSRVFDYCSSVPQWQLGFGVVTVVEEKSASKDFHMDLIEIKNNRAVVQGKVFKG